MTHHCHACQTPYEEKDAPGSRSECLSCQAPLHCCANCRDHDPRNTPWCNEPAARDELPRDPKAANTCGWFMFRKSKAEEAKPGPASGEDTPDWMKVEKPPDKPLFG